MSDTYKVLMHIVGSKKGVDNIYKIVSEIKADVSIPTQLEIPDCCNKFHEGSNASIDYYAKYMGTCQISTESRGSPELWYWQIIARENNCKIYYQIMETDNYSVFSSNDMHSRYFSDNILYSVCLDSEFLAYAKKGTYAPIEEYDATIKIDTLDELCLNLCGMPHYLLEAKLRQYIQDKDWNSDCFFNAQIILRRSDRGIWSWINPRAKILTKAISGCNNIPKIKIREIIYSWDDATLDHVSRQIICGKCAWDILKPYLLITI